MKTDANRSPYHHHCSNSSQDEGRYLVQETLELNNGSFCFYRHHHLVGASVELKGRVKKRVSVASDVYLSVYPVPLKRD